MLATTAQEKLLARLTEGATILSERIDRLNEAVVNTNHSRPAAEQAQYEHDVVIPAMNALRETADELETIVERDYWPFPTYSDLLFRV